MWDGLAIDMLPFAKRRWRTLSQDDRFVLAFAFRDAIRRPDRVGDYRLEFYQLSTGEIIQFHTFRFGYANFILATNESILFICDFWLDEDYAMAAE